MFPQISPKTAAILATVIGGVAYVSGKRDEVAGHKPQSLGTVASAALAIYGLSNIKPFYGSLGVIAYIGSEILLPSHDLRPAARARALLDTLTGLDGGGVADCVNPKDTPVAVRWRECYAAAEKTGTGFQDCGPDPVLYKDFANWYLCKWQHRDPTLVRSIQYALGVKVDGIVGRDTRTALARAQAKWKLPATGRMDRMTIFRMAGFSGDPDRFESW
jgi:hypothetical protein